MKIIYIRDEGKRPIGVMVYEATEQAIRYGTAICGSRDKWDRSRGREIAKGRLALVGFRSNALPWTYGEFSNSGRVVDLLFWLSERETTPTRFAQACNLTARNWLAAMADKATKAA